MRSPGGENENAGTPDSEKINVDSATDAAPTEEKGFFGKIKEALQDWSNVDKSEQDIDDATP